MCNLRNDEPWTNARSKQQTRRLIHLLPKDSPSRVGKPGLGFACVTGPSMSLASRRLHSRPRASRGIRENDAIRGPRSEASPDDKSENDPAHREESGSGRKIGSDLNSIEQMITLPGASSQNCLPANDRRSRRARQARMVHPRCLSDITYHLGKIVYGRVCDFDSEIHFGMSARTSSIDLLSSG